MPIVWQAAHRAWVDDCFLSSLGLYLLNEFTGELPSELELLAALTRLTLFTTNCVGRFPLILAP
jgi:hypothetical protein